MVTEVAQLEIYNENIEDFFDTLTRSIHLLQETQGFISIEVQQQIENTSVVYLIIKWDKLDDHLIGFRQSEKFVSWRNSLGKFFKSDPVVNHFEKISII